VSPRRLSAIARTTTGLSVVALILAGTLGFVLVIQPSSLIHPMTTALTSTQVVTSIGPTTLLAPDAYSEGEVANAYATHVAQLSGRDIIALGGGYESNATVYWTGDALELAGTYSGVTNIEILWGSTIGKSINFSVSDEHQSIPVIQGDAYVVNSTLDFQLWTYYYCSDDAGTALGNINGSVVAQDVYEHIPNNNNSSSWSIARETWNFSQLNVRCFPATAQSSSSSTSITRTTATTTTFTLPTCYNTLDTVLNPAPSGTVYMKVVTNQGAVITNGTLFVTQSGKTAFESLTWEAPRRTTASS
jgi:hypothetical protein